MEPPPTTTAHITPAVARVIEELVTDGAGNQELADRLHISTYCVKQYLTTAYREARVTSRAALVLWWIRGGRYQYLERTRA